jgi:hypothetical protein
VRAASLRHHPAVLQPRRALDDVQLVQAYGPSDCERSGQRTSKTEPTEVTTVGDELVVMNSRVRGVPP